jgi:RNA polymerase sigma factor (TIGR02999 family)
LALEKKVGLTTPQSVAMLSGGIHKPEALPSGDPMGQLSSTEVTRLLMQWRNGDQDALAQLIPLVYDDLRQLARNYLRRERQGHTLQPTALVHEVFIRLAGQTHPDWKNRAQFFGVAAQMMRRILIDYARKRRHRPPVMVPIDNAFGWANAKPMDLIALDDALTALGKVNARQALIVELSFFGGLTISEIAEVLQFSRATVLRDWRTARDRLYEELNRK